MKISVQCQLYVHLLGLEFRELGFILIMSNYCDSLSVSTLCESSKAYGMVQNRGNQNIFVPKAFKTQICSAQK